MKKIAFSEHSITPEFIKFTQSDSKSMNMEIAGIDIEILALTASFVVNELDRNIAAQLSSKLNDFLAEEISINPGRYRGLANLSLQNPRTAAAELDRCIRDYKFVGGLINPPNDRYLSGEQFFPFWEKVQELDVPIYLSNGNSSRITQRKDPDAPDKAILKWSPNHTEQILHMVFGGSFDRFPKIKLILGGMGEMIPYLLWQLENFWAVLHFPKIIKKRPDEYLKDNIYITTSGISSEILLQCAIEVLGEKGILFSVNKPNEISEIDAHYIENGPISNTLREMIFHKNAESILRLNN